MSRPSPVFVKPEGAPAMPVFTDAADEITDPCTCNRTDPERTNAHQRGDLRWCLDAQDVAGRTA